MSRGSGWSKWALGFQLSVLQPPAPTVLPTSSSPHINLSRLLYWQAGETAFWQAEPVTYEPTCQTSLSGLFSGHSWQQQLRRLIYLEKFTEGERMLLRWRSWHGVKNPRCGEGGAEGREGHLCWEFNNTKPPKMRWGGIRTFGSIMFIMSLFLIDDVIHLLCTSSFLWPVILTRFLSR